MLNSRDDNTYRNTSTTLSFEPTSLGVNPRNNTGSLYFEPTSQDLNYINISDTKYYMSRLVGVTVPEYKIILDFFDMIGGIY